MQFSLLELKGIQAEITRLQYKLRFVAPNPKPDFTFADIAKLKKWRELLCAAAGIQLIEFGLLLEDGLPNNLFVLNKLLTEMQDFYEADGYLLRFSDLMTLLNEEIAKSPEKREREDAYWTTIYGEEIVCDLD
jgi:hypothetical protein